MDVMSKYKLRVGPATCTLQHSEALPFHIRPSVLELADVFVPKKYRKQGWGSELLKNACTLADTYGFVTILHVEDDKDYLLPWYAKFGFDVLQIEPELLMVRPVNGNNDKTVH